MSLIVRFVHLLSAVALIFALAIPAVFAQDPVVPTTEAGEVPGDTLYCTQTVSARPLLIKQLADIPETLSGQSVTFVGEIQNQADYPIAEASVFARVYRDNPDSDLITIVDQFMVAESVSLAAGASEAIEHEWLVPRGAPGGEYNIQHTVILNDDRENGRHTARFTVMNPTTNDLVELSEETLEVNGELYENTALLRLPNTAAAVISTTITNPTAETKVVPLQWYQYGANLTDPNQALYADVKLITLEANETRTVSYQVKPQSENIVQVTATLQDGQNKSFLNVRLVNEGSAQVSVPYAGLYSFPLAADTEASTFACLQDVVTNDLSDVTVVLSLYDKDDTLIHQFDSSDTPGDQSIYTDTFSVTETYDYVRLEAVAAKSGVLQDTVTIVYDCEAIDPASCSAPVPVAPAVTDGSTNDLSQSAGALVMQVVGVMVLLLIVIIVFVLFRKKGVGSKDVNESVADEPADDEDASNDPTNTMIKSIIVLFAFVGLFASFAPQAQAATVTQGSPAKQYRLNPPIMMDTYHEVWARLSGPNVVAPGGTLNLTAEIWCDGLSNSPMFRGVEFIVHDDGTGTSYNPLISGTNNCPDFFAAPLTAPLVITAPMAPNTYTVRFNGFGDGNPSYLSLNTIPQSTFTYTVAAANNPPTANAGPDDVITQPTQSYNAFGIGTDSDGTIAGYNWQFLSGPPAATAVSIANPTTTSPTFNNLTAVGTYTFELVVTDNDGDPSAPDTMEVEVVPPAAFPSVTLMAFPGTADLGDSVDMTWTTTDFTGAVTCDSTGPGWNNVGLPDTGTNVPVTMTQPGNPVNYIITCTDSFGGSALDTEQVIVNNTAPSVPNIIVTSSNPDTVGNASTFLASSTDPEGGQVYYEIDYHPTNNVEDQTSSFMVSGVDLAYNPPAWATDGVKTFQIRASDGYATSTWSSFSITINPAPSPSGTLSLGSGSCDIAIGDSTCTIPMTWTSANAPTPPVEIRVNGTPEATGPTGNNAPVPIDYGPNTVTLTHNGGAPLAPSETPTGDCVAGSTWNSGVCEALPDLTGYVSIGPLTPEDLGSGPTGNYIEVEFDLVMSEPSGATMNNFDVYLELMVNGTMMDNTTLLNINDTDFLPRPPGNEVRTVIFNPATPFSFTDTVIVQGQIDPGNTVTEVDDGNNDIAPVVVGAGVPSITMDFTVDPAELVRGGNTVMLRWNTNAVFPMSCSVEGPSLTTVTFDPSDTPVDTDGPVWAGPIGEVETGPITAKSVYSLTCVEPNTGTTFTETVEIESTGTVQEV